MLFSACYIVPHLKHHADSELWVQESRQPESSMEQSEFTLGYFGSAGWILFFFLLFFFPWKISP